MAAHEPVGSGEIVASEERTLLESGPSSTLRDACGRAADMALPKSDMNEPEPEYDDATQEPASKRIRRSSKGTQSKRKDASPPNKFYRVEKHLHLGLGLAVGKTYSEADLLARCKGNQKKMEAVQEGLKDAKVFFEVPAPKDSTSSAKPLDTPSTPSVARKGAETSVAASTECSTRDTSQGEPVKKGARKSTGARESAAAEVAATTSIVEVNGKDARGGRSRGSGVASGARGKVGGGADSAGRAPTTNELSPSTVVPRKPRFITGQVVWHTTVVPSRPARVTGIAPERESEAIYFIRYIDKDSGEDELFVPPEALRAFEMKELGSVPLQVNASSEVAPPKERMEVIRRPGPRSSSHFVVNEVVWFFSVHQPPWLAEIRRVHEGTGPDVRYDVRPMTESSEPADSFTVRGRDLVAYVPGDVRALSALADSVDSNFESRPSAAKAGIPNRAVLHDATTPQAGVVELPVTSQESASIDDRSR